MSQCLLYNIERISSAAARCEYNFESLTEIKDDVEFASNYLLLRNQYMRFHKIDYLPEYPEIDPYSKQIKIAAPQRPTCCPGIDPHQKTIKVNM